MPTQWQRVERVIHATPRALVNRYLKYWRSIAPKNHLDYYHRFLFAFASIRMTWQSNCKLFIALKAMPPYFSLEDLNAVLQKSHCGMYDVRSRALWEFHQVYWANPNCWYPQPDEHFTKTRDRIEAALHGMGPAKAAFVLEMAYPAVSEVACLDTHMLQLYGVDTAVSDSRYRELESHWCDTCAKAKLPSPMVRHIYWDKLRGMTDTTYWSHVLHHGCKKFVPVEAETV